MDDGIAVPELAAVIDLDGNLRQFLDHEFPGEPRVPARPAGDDLNALKFAEFVLGNVHLIEENFSRIERNPADQRVSHGARLLENFLLHEMLESALFRHDRIPRNVLREALDGVAFQRPSRARRRA